MAKVETFTPPNTPTPIGPYRHIARVGGLITIGGTAGVDPSSSPGRTSNRRPGRSSIASR